MSVPPAATGRVALRDLDLSSAADIIAGRRRPGWSPGYPTDGDRDIARWLSSHPPGTGVDRLYQPKQIIDMDSGLAVGGIGCHQPPGDDGTVEIGYGIAPEVRNQGLTTEAVRLLLAGLRLGGVRLVKARTDRENPPSQAILRRHGFVEAGTGDDGLLVWHLALTP